ncbi:MAG: metal ABC transporter ATP-binding protein [Meiothermus sp.]|uniref:metal ABC transporter ATP-binding protein n=1 Tax=Meiothermus sp. TaxID=1955249 RepID=UPI0025E664DC|nr:metal ABC transporter ATP-binding protein [Meiothermus sp.]MCS7058637.1 metal ABC transporter ATP-binding protein [Meiothermus sp.]MCS7193897.1 metal ABC transporter ATP-binding protein [Meiothermus sp.]MCX7739887.1 metal ABC transporter ATP-binding protein [Meiothermus sp.]MDW8090157.1 metal ABC transporter ATP-binding protein [Meiothermus sp.]MDW8481459.1 metal ABC transporter ATP-binding protein [Meiothermus sp.]
MTPPPLEILDLTVIYRDRPVLWDVDLTIPEGQLCAIVGPNGAGKSTLIKAALGMVPKASGRVRFFGQPLEQVRRRIGYVPQRTSVDWDFPTHVLDVVMMGLYGRLGWFRRPGKKEREAAMEALEQVALSDLAYRQISELSGGQQQRVFLARALVQDADLYFMDEPFAGVDAVSEEAILRVLEGLRARGKTAVIVHHDLQTVREYFAHLTLLNVQVIASGPTESTFTPRNLERTYGKQPLPGLDGQAEPERVWNS